MRLFRGFLFLAMSKFSRVRFCFYLPWNVHRLVFLPIFVSRFFLGGGQLMLGPPRMAVQKQDDQHEHTFSNYMRIQDVVQKTCLRRWTIGKSGERGSGISVLPALHDDDDETNLPQRFFMQSLSRSIDVSTLSSMLASLLPSFLDTYSLSPSSMRCKALCIVLCSLVLRFICWSSPVYFKNVPEYLTRRTAQDFIPLMRYLLWSLALSSFLVLQTYSLLILFYSSHLVWGCPLPKFPSFSNMCIKDVWKVILSFKILLYQFFHFNFYPKGIISIRMK